MTKPELVAKAKDQDRRIQELEDTLAKLEDMVINQAQDLHGLQREVAEINSNGPKLTRFAGLPD